MFKSKSTIYKTFGIFHLNELEYKFIQLRINKYIKTYEIKFK